MPPELNGNVERVHYYYREHLFVYLCLNVAVSEEKRASQQSISRYMHMDIVQYQLFLCSKCMLLGFRTVH